MKLLMKLDDLDGADIILEKKAIFIPNFFSFVLLYYVRYNLRNNIVSLNLILGCSDFEFLVLLKPNSNLPKKSFTCFNEIPLKIMKILFISS